MTNKQLSARLRRARRELDECAEWIDRLAADLDKAKQPAVEVLGLTELSEVLGLNYKTVQQRQQRGTLLEPHTVLACGPIWLRSEVERWMASKKVAA